MLTAETSLELDGDLRYLDIPCSTYYVYCSRVHDAPINKSPDISRCAETRVLAGIEILFFYYDIHFALLIIIVNSGSDWDCILWPIRGERGEGQETPRNKIDNLQIPDGMNIWG